MANEEDDRLAYSTPSLTPYASESSATQAAQDMDKYYTINEDVEYETESDFQDQQPTEAIDYGNLPDQVQKDSVDTTYNMSLNNQTSHDRDDICSPSTDVEPSVEIFCSVVPEVDIVLENKSLESDNFTGRQSLCRPYTDDVDEISVIKQATTTTTTIFTDYAEPKKKKNDIGHIMISYNHSTKPLCTRIAQALKSLNYDVWIDQENISGDVLTSMASAIENSFVVLMAINEQYSQSRYCRLEAEYSVERNKASIPMLMQSGYKAAGWLGIINGSKLHIDFSTLPFDDAFSLLRREIEAVRKSLGADEIEQTNTSIMSSQSMTTMNTSWHHNQNVHDWNADDVVEWLNREKLSIFEPVLAGFTGATLWQLYKIRSESAPDYYRTIESLLLPTAPLRLFHNLTFNAALEALFSSLNQKLHR